MTLGSGARKFVLTIHLTASLGWIGAVMAYLALGISATTSPEAQTIRAAWIAMEIVISAVIVPLAVAALLTGVVLSLATPWGLFRHYWVVISFALTILATTVLLLHVSAVRTFAGVAREAPAGELGRLGGDFLHAGLGLLVLLVIAVLNVYKPRGLTRYGWRRQQDRERGTA